MDRNEFGQFITGHKSFNKKGKDSPMRKGGKPRCWCGKILSRYEYKNCGIHRIITSATRKKLSISLAGNNCSPKGEKNHLWKGGITPVNNKIRQSIFYKNWRKAVFERDDYTCQHCKIKGGILHADHIKPFYLYLELRFELSNGRTLCQECHRKTPTWGYKSRHIKQKVI